MRYSTVDEVVRIHIAETGEDLLADFGKLESAVMRPLATVGGEDAYRDIHAKAGALLHSLARNHAFIDGNKRTALLASVMLYKINGWAVEAEQGAMVALVLDAAEGQIDASGIAGVLKGWARECSCRGTRTSRTDESSEERKSCQPPSRARAMRMRCTSLVPSPISSTFASR